MSPMISTVMPEIAREPKCERILADEEKDTGRAAYSENRRATA